MKCLKDVSPICTVSSVYNYSNYPHSDDPLSDCDFYWTSDDQLLTVLNKKIEPQESDLTYETLIYDALHDMKLANSIAQPVWTVNPEIEKYFEKMAEVNVWAEAGSAISKEAMKMAIVDLGGSGIGVDCVLMLPDLCEAGIGLKLLDATFYRRALWYYFLSRELDFSPEQAFEDALVVDLFRNKYNNPEMREYFESLWTEYGAPHISDDDGLKPDFKKQVINQLRTLLLSGFENINLSRIRYIVSKTLARYKCMTPRDEQ